MPPLRGRAQVRPRTAGDLPVLVTALLAQQAETHYPFRDPPPMPLEEFLHGHDAVRAWTAELDGLVVGQVCRIGPAQGFADADLLNDVCARAHGCTVPELAWVSALFVAAEARGLGLARELLRVVVDDIRAAGLEPCLEVLSIHPAAARLYTATGWRVVHRFRPAWLREAAGDDGPDVRVMVLAT